MDQNDIINGLRIPVAPQQPPGTFNAGQAEAILKGLAEPFGQAGRLMTGQTENLPEDALGLMTSAMPFPVKGAMLPAALKALKPLQKGTGVDQVAHFYKNVPAEHFAQLDNWIAEHLEHEPSKLSPSMNHIKQDPDTGFALLKNPDDVYTPGKIAEYTDKLLAGLGQGPSSYTPAKPSIIPAKQSIIKPLASGTPEEQLAHFGEQFTNKSFMTPSPAETKAWIDENFMTHGGSFIKTPYGIAIPKPHIYDFHEKPIADILGEIGALAQHEPATLNPPKTDYAEKLIEKAMKNIEPVDWHRQSPVLGRRGESHIKELIPNSTIENLHSQGYNPSLPLYKGYSSPRYRDVTEFRDPRYNTRGRKKDEPALFFGDDPRVANYYASHGIGTFFSSPKDPMAVDWRAVSPSYDYDPAVMSSIIEAGHRKGADLLTIKEMEDAGSSQLQNQYLMLKDPGQMRFGHAAYDPQKKGKSGLLLGLGGLTVPGMIDALRSPQ